MSPAAQAAPAAQSSSPASLQVTASPRPGSRVALEVAIPGSRSQASYDAALEKLSRTVKLPGFRKGRVPRPVLLQQIGPLRIRATAISGSRSSPALSARRNSSAKCRMDRALCWPPTMTKWSWCPFSQAMNTTPVL